MLRIGIRELSEHASEILRTVREEGRSFEITYHGRAIARVIPISAPSANETAADFWTEWDQLGVSISANWLGEHDATRAVSEDRREL